VGIGVNALEVLDVAFDQAQAAAGSRVIGVHHQAVAERCRHRGIRANYLAAQGGKIEFAVRIADRFHG